MKDTGDESPAAEIASWSELLRTPPRKENLQQIDLNPGVFASLLVFLFKAIFVPLFKICNRLKIKGRSNIPPAGPYILYANHTSYLDAFLIAAALPRRALLDLFFVGFRIFFNVPVIRHLVRPARIIPLDFSSYLLEALRSCFYVLKSRKDICVFPEGTRTFDGKIQNFKKGFAILVKESQAAIIPVVIEGAFEAWPRTASLPRLHPITIRFGSPLRAPELERKGFLKGGKDAYDAINIAAREALLNLKNHPTPGESEG